MDVNIRCPRCAANKNSIARDGTYFRADDAKFVQRYKCKVCRKQFSSATFKPTYKQKNRQYVDEYVRQSGPIKTVQFDDLITFEHTKCKPLSVPVAVVDGQRIPLCFGVASIPAFGHLAQPARKKYGKRNDHSRQLRESLFEELKTMLPPAVTFKTDGHEHYARLIKKHFPDSQHEVFTSDRGAIVGQGELKKTTFDNLFSINHTFATMRAKVNRLNRRTWCTTKKPERLVDHIDIFIDVFCDRLKLLAINPKTMQRRAASAVI